VNYAIVDGEVYCTAGFGAVSDWYRNIRTNPEVEVWLPDGWWAGVAEEVTDAKAVAVDYDDPAAACAAAAETLTNGRSTP
jgi:hypothetical protein